MFVLGIDPGLSRCGYGAVVRDGRRTRAVAVGVIRTDPGEVVPRRLAALQVELRRLVDEHRPDVVAVERVFFQVNARTAIGVAQASGLAQAEGARSGAEVVEYTPNQVKEAVGGWGGASKEEVARMVQSLLGLAEAPRPADAADAAAVALCHLAHAPFRARAGRAARRLGAGGRA